MNITFNIGTSIACVCILIVLIILILYSGSCETIEEELGLIARSNENTIVENPVNNV